MKRKDPDRHQTRTSFKSPAPCGSGNYLSPTHTQPVNPKPRAPQHTFNQLVRNKEPSSSESKRGATLKHTKHRSELLARGRLARDNTRQGLAHQKANAGPSLTKCGAAPQWDGPATLSQAELRQTLETNQAMSRTASATASATRVSKAPGMM